MVLCAMMDEELKCCQDATNKRYAQKRETDTARTPAKAFAEANICFQLDAS